MKEQEEQTESTRLNTHGGISVLLDPGPFCGNVCHCNNGVPFEIDEKIRWTALQAHGNFARSGYSNPATINAQLETIPVVPPRLPTLQQDRGGYLEQKR